MACILPQVRKVVERSVLSPDVEADGELVAGGIGHDVPYEAEVPPFDTLLGQGAGDGEDEGAVLDGHGVDGLEPCPPCGIRHLGPQHGRALRPQVLGFRHQDFRLPVTRSPQGDPQLWINRVGFSSPVEPGRQ